MFLLACGGLTRGGDFIFIAETGGRLAGRRVVTNVQVVYAIRSNTWTGITLCRMQAIIAGVRIAALGGWRGRLLVAVGRPRGL